jgi:hypothetical protein
MRGTGGGPSSFEAHICSRLRMGAVGRCGWGLRSRDERKRHPGPSFCRSRISLALMRATRGGTDLPVVSRSLLVFRFGRNSNRASSSRTHQEGRCASSRTWSAGCDGRFRCARRARLRSGRRSRVVLAPRRWRQVRGRFLRTTGARKPGPREEHEGSRKTIAQGMPEMFGEPVVTILVCFHLSHTRPWVRLIHPAFPAPSVVEGKRHNSGEARRENAAPYADEPRFSLPLAVKSGERRKNRQVLSFPDFGARTPPRPRPPHPWRLAVDENGPRCGL